MSYTREEVLEFVQENDVKFVRLTFCDIFGAPKNIAVMAEYLPRVFELGTGFDASAIGGFLNITQGDLHLFPDPATLAVLPWRPQNGRVARLFCNLHQPDGAVFEGDGRHILRAARQKALDMGLQVKARFECEFYLFETDDAGRPTLRPHDNAGYLDIAPLDRCEDVRRGICLALEEMGMAPMGSHHKKGPGQNEVWCRAGDILACADDLITYKTVVRTIAAQNGLFAAFMPKPLPGESGNGLHMHLSLHAAPGAAESRVSQDIFHAFVAGVLEHLREITLFLNPTPNSYSRLAGPDMPGTVGWAQGNGAELLRLPYTPNEDTRMELRSPDPLCNPYHALALVLQAGLEGIAARAVLPREGGEASGGIAANKARRTALPATLGQAIEAAQGSLFVQRSLPAALLDKLFESKLDEWAHYTHAEDTHQFELAHYLERI